MADRFERGIKFSDDKIRLDLLPPHALHAIAAGFTYGGVKYEEWNHAKGIPSHDLYRAALNHLTTWFAGEDDDGGPDGSGLPHLWLAGCCIMMLIEGQEARPDFDDRPKGKVAPAFPERYRVVYERAMAQARRMCAERLAEEDARGEQEKIRQATSGYGG